MKEIKVFFGYLIFGFILVSIFIIQANAYGLKDTSIAWLVVIGIGILVMFAVWLIDPPPAKP